MVSNPLMSPFVSDTTVPMPMPESFWVSLADKCLTIAFLAGALYFMGKLFVSVSRAKDKVQEAKDALYAQIIAQMTARLDSVESRIKDCEEDRRNLRNRLDSMSRSTESKIDTHSGTP